MGKTYRNQRTTNKARKSRAVERVTKKAQRVLSYEEMLEFIECLNEAKAERNEVAQ